MMKKWVALMMGLLLVCLCAAGYAEQVERIPASYLYELTADGAYVENLIFNGDVVISGNDSQIIFSNCEFNGDIILTADEGTKVMLFGCDVNGVCVISNSVVNASIEYSNPKFLTDAPVTVVCEGCVGSVVALGDFEVVFDGTSYTMADSEMFAFMDGEEYVMVPYEGQEASYYVVGRWYENDQQQTLVMCEFDPTM